MKMTSDDARSPEGSGPVGVKDQFHKEPRIALIGNGPISKSEASRIDGFDIVVRMNYARLCGPAGKRTDILILPLGGRGAEAIIHNRPINRLAATSAREIWLSPNDDSTDRSLEEIERLIIRGRPRVILPESLRQDIVDVISKYSDTREIGPSTGAKVLLFLLRNYPEYRITLFGFTHSGWRGHPWSAVAAWVDELVQEGRLSRAELIGPLVKISASELIQAETIRMLRWFRRTARRRSKPTMGSKGSRTI
jgi:hypothetical protein